MIYLIFFAIVSHDFIKWFKIKFIKIIQIYLSHQLCHATQLLQVFTSHVCTHFAHKLRTPAQVLVHDGVGTSSAAIKRWRLWIYKRIDQKLEVVVNIIEKI